VCELHKPIGNLREKPFGEIWHSTEARELRKSIAAKQCWCTTEVFLWSSINYQPVHLAKAMLGAKVWEKVPPLPASEATRYDVIAYPAKGQSAEQQSRDRYECHSWAVSQSGFDPASARTAPAASVADTYKRALGACLTGRGYSVN